MNRPACIPTTQASRDTTRRHNRNDTREREDTPASRPAEPRRGGLGHVLALGALLSIPTVAPVALDLTWATSQVSSTAAMEEANEGITAPAAVASAEKRQSRLAEQYRRARAGQSDLETFARLAETAAHSSGGDADVFVADLSRFILGATSNEEAIVAGPWGRLQKLLHIRVPLVPDREELDRFGSNGFAADDDSNQVHHFWYSVAVAYRWGREIAEFAAWYREWNPRGPLSLMPGTGGGHGTEMDLILALQGVELGRALRSGTIRPVEVADWLRRELAASANQGPALSRSA